LFDARGEWQIATQAAVYEYLLNDEIWSQADWQLCGRADPVADIQRCPSARQKLSSVHLG